MYQNKHCILKGKSYQKKISIFLNAKLKLLVLLKYSYFLVLDVLGGLVNLAVLVLMRFSQFGI